MAVGALALALLPAAAVELLAEGLRDAAPALEGEVVGGAVLHAGVPVLEVAAGHAVAGRVAPHAAPQALLVAALVVAGAGTVLTVDRAHCRRGGGGERDRGGWGELVSESQLQSHVVKGDIEAWHEENMGRC